MGLSRDSRVGPGTTTTTAGCDIFATSYDLSLEDIVRGVIGEPHGRNCSRLYRNLQGRGFQDVAREAGLDSVYATMGSNFGDFDNDGFLDMLSGNR